MACSSYPKVGLVYLRFHLKPIIIHVMNLALHLDNLPVSLNKLLHEGCALLYLVFLDDNSPLFLKINETLESTNFLLATALQVIIRHCEFAKLAPQVSNLPPQAIGDLI